MIKKIDSRGKVSYSDADNKNSVDKLLHTPNGEECLKCGYEWTSRIENPVCCPRCKRYDYLVKPKEKTSEQIKAENFWNFTHNTQEDFPKEEETPISIPL